MPPEHLGIGETPLITGAVVLGVNSSKAPCLLRSTSGSFPRTQPFWYSEAVMAKVPATVCAGGRPGTTHMMLIL